MKGWTKDDLLLTLILAVMFMIGFIFGYYAGLDAA